MSIRRFAVVCGGLYLMQSAGYNERLRHFLGGNLHVKTCLFKAVNNLGEGWMITEEDDGFSAVGNDFLQYFT